jgi:hypothetical protein
VLSVNEDREQTQAIHRVQREAQTLEGLLQRRDREAILAVHRNARRMLKPVFVANPYAREMQSSRFSFANENLGEKCRTFPILILKSFAYLPWREA